MELVCIIIQSLFVSISLFQFFLLLILLVPVHFEWHLRTQQNVRTVREKESGSLLIWNGRDWYSIKHRNAMSPRFISTRIWHLVRKKKSIFLVWNWFCCTSIRPLFKNPNWSTSTSVRWVYLKTWLFQIVNGMALAFHSTIRHNQQLLIMFISSSAPGTGNDERIVCFAFVKF